MKLTACSWWPWQFGPGELFLVDVDENSAAEALNQYLLASSIEPDLVRALKLFGAGKTGPAEQLCRNFLHQNPANVIASRLLADIGMKVGVYADAENLLERCLELATDFSMARLSYAQVLEKREKLDLPFAEACLPFHQTERAVRAASSEQVRQPTYNGALVHWRNYEQHLDELKDSLAPRLDRYPID